MCRMLQPGDRVTWRGVNRDYTGEVLKLTPSGYLVRLDLNGKQVLLAEQKEKINRGISPH